MHFATWRFVVLYNGQFGKEADAERTANRWDLWIEYVRPLGERQNGPVVIYNAVLRIATWRGRIYQGPEVLCARKFSSGAEKRPIARQDPVLLAWTVGNGAEIWRSPIAEPGP